MTVKTKIILLLFVILIGATIFFANKWRNNSSYDKVTIIGAYTIDEDEILKLARIKDSVVNLEDLSLKTIQERISGHSEIKKVFVSKEPPNELKIEIIEKRPVAILNTDTEIKLIDDELEIFNFTNSLKMHDLPVISGVRIENDPKLTSKFNKEDLKLALFIILNAYKKSKLFYNQISEVNLSNSDKVVVYGSDKSIPFYLPRYIDKNIYNKEYQYELSNKLVVLKNFLEQPNINKDENYSYVDLRFNNCVIVNDGNQSEL